MGFFLKHLLKKVDFTKKLNSSCADLIGNLLHLIVEWRRTNSKRGWSAVGRQKTPSVVTITSCHYSRVNLISLVHKARRFQFCKQIMRSVLISGSNPNPPRLDSRLLIRALPTKTPGNRCFLPRRASGRAPPTSRQHVSSVESRPGLAACVPPCGLIWSRLDEVKVMWLELSGWTDVTNGSF